MFALCSITVLTPVQTIDALAMALNDYPGAVVIVSHDERLVSLVCNEMWIVHQGEVIQWDKDWDAYKKTLQKELGDMTLQ